MKRFEFFFGGGRVEFCGSIDGNALFFSSFSFSSLPRLTLCRLHFRVYAPPPTPGASHANEGSDARSSSRHERTSASSGALVDAAALPPPCLEEDDELPPFHRQRTSPPRVKATTASSMEGGGALLSDRGGWKREE